MVSATVATASASTARYGSTSHGEAAEAVSTGAEVGGLKERLRDGLHAARSSLAELESEVSERAREAARMTSDRAREAARATSERAREAARYTDDYVHEHPWAVVGVAAGIGALIALILSRR